MLPGRVDHAALPRAPAEHGVQGGAQPEAEVLSARLARACLHSSFSLVIQSCGTKLKEMRENDVV